MIFFIIQMIFVVSIITIAITKKVEIREKRVSIIVLLINIFVMLFFRFMCPVESSYGEITIAFYILLIINITLFVILLLKTKKVNKKIFIVLMIVYFICMFFLPIYKVESHEHDFSQGNESIKYYIDYYNCYSIQINRIYK